MTWAIARVGRLPQRAPAIPAVTSVRPQHRAAARPSTIRAAPESGPAVFLWSAAGTAASLGLAATFGVAQQLLWCAVYLILFPVCVVIGFGAWLVVGSVVRRPAVPARQDERRPR